MRASFQRKGFTIAELMVAMTIMTLLSGVLVAFYGQSELILSRGITQTGLQQAARLASIRIIPKITSAVPKPATPSDPAPLSDPLPAIVSPAPPPDEVTPPVVAREIVLTSVTQYVQDQLRETVTVFNPRQPTYRQYRIFFLLDASKNQADPKVAPGGRIGNLWLDGNTPGNAADDILLASNLFDVTFEHETDNVVHLTVTAKGFMKAAVGGRILDTQTYSTRIFLPIFTNTPGGT